MAVLRRLRVKKSTAWRKSRRVVLERVYWWALASVLAMSRAMMATGPVHSLVWPAGRLVMAWMDRLIQVVEMLVWGAGVHSSTNRPWPRRALVRAMARHSLMQPMRASLLRGVVPVNESIKGWVSG
jgi:hypothetical protein